MKTVVPSAGEPFLSVVVPAFNEAARISEPLRAIDAYLHAQPYAAEMIIVNDGSTDETLATVRAVAAGLRTPTRVCSYEQNRGKGHALKVGFAEARGQCILFTDADLSTPIEEASRLLPFLSDGFDVVIGSRHMAGAHIAVHQPWYRERMGAVFTWLVASFIAPVSDATCGFKAFTRAAGKDVFARVRRFDWSFDAEVLFLARRLGYRLKEIPVQWADRQGTKVRLGGAVVRALLGLAAIRWRGVGAQHAAAATVQGIGSRVVPDVLDSQPRPEVTPRFPVE